MHFWTRPLSISLSLAENRLAVFYNNDQLFGVCTRALLLASGSSRLSFSSIYSFYTAEFFRVS